VHLANIRIDNRVLLAEIGNLEFGYDYVHDCWHTMVTWEAHPTGLKKGRVCFSCYQLYYTPLRPFSSPSKHVVVFICAPLSPSGTDPFTVKSVEVED
jgi:hypothetical protein